MKATIHKQSDTQATFTVSMDKKALEPIVANTYNRLRQSLKVAGFRPGKAPDSIVDRELGANSVQNEILEAATSNSYAQAVRENKLPVVTQPEVKIIKFVPYTELEYEATVELLPPIKLGDYKKLSAKLEQPKVEEAEIDQVISDLGKRTAGRNDVTRAAKLGDEVTLDFDGTKAGKPVQGAKSANFPLVLGSGSFIPGFEDQVVGLKAGDEKTFDITFPKDYGQSELAGQKVQFAIKAHKITELTTPEVNDAFAAEVGPYKTVKELREAIAENIRGEKGRTADQEYERVLLSELQKKSTLSVPQKLIEQQVARLRHELEDNLSQRGQSVEDYAKSQNMTVEQLDKEVEPEAKRRIELALILTEVAKAEGITVSDQEVKDELGRLRGQYTDPEMQRELDRPETSEEIYNHLMASRTIAKIKDYNGGK